MKIKVSKRKDKKDDWVGYPYNVLGNLPDCDCVFDSYHGGVGIDIFPYALNTRINASNQVFLKIYEEDTEEVLPKRVLGYNSIGGVSRTLLSTYHKIGVYNVLEHNFPAVMEIYEDTKPVEEPD
jgi:hypothetical protein